MGQSVRKDNKDDLDTESNWPSDENFSLQKLKRILLAPERGEIQRLKQTVHQPEELARAVSDILPEAVTLRNRKDQTLQRAFQPVVSTGVKDALTKSPLLIVDAIIPILGPVIRKAIQTALQGFVQSMNVMAQNTVSLNAVKWRIQAALTGRSFAELVILNSLIYRVEQVFLIHRETGLPVVHRVAENVSIQDPALVAGMMTAIGDFITDSFETPQDDSLSDICIGDLHVVIERGRQVYLAAAVRGNFPTTLRDDLRDALLAIDVEQTEVLSRFADNPEQCHALKQYLDPCFQVELAPRESRVSPVLWFLLFGIFAGLFYLLGSYGYREWKWSRFHEALQNEPGIQVTREESENGKRIVHGFRDSFARTPAGLLQVHKIDPEHVQFLLEPYTSHSQKFVLLRAKKVLSPPENIRLRFLNGTLFARGMAPHRWIEQFRLLALLVPGVDRIDDTGLEDQDLKDFEQLLQVAATIIYIPPAALSHCTGDGCFLRSGHAGRFFASPTRKQALPVSEVVETFGKLGAVANTLGKRISVRVIGFDASASGGRSGPSELLASSVVQILQRHGLIGLVLIPLPATKASHKTKADRHYVSFDVIS